jgi:alpha-N-arabinofuranosidase
MKKVDPSIRIITCGSGDFGRTWGQGDTAVFRHASKHADYHSVHFYETAERFADGPSQAEKFFRKLARRIARCPNPALKLYVSEWNCMTTDWRTGLYAGGILNVLERCSAITPMAGPALWLRHVCGQGWDNALVNFDHKAWFPAPNYVVMKLWREHYAPYRIAMHGRTKPLNIVATRSQDGRRVFLKCVNPGGAAVPVTVRLAGFSSAPRACLREVTPGGTVLRNMLGDPDRVRVAPGAVEVRNGAICFTMPGLSVAVLTLERP